MATDNASDLGRAGEQVAVKHLKRNRYKIIERNYRSFYGEIDIIARDGDTLAFVEVKARSSEEYGSPGEAVGWRKQARLSRAAMDYVTRNNLTDVKMRFDVVSIMGEGKGQAVQLIKNAFDFRES